MILSLGVSTIGPLQGRGPGNSAIVTADILKTLKMKFNAGQCYSVIAQNAAGMLLESMVVVGRVDWDGWIGCVVDVVCMPSPVVLTLSPALSRRLFLPAQVAQGALLGALVRPAQDHVRLFVQRPSFKT